MTHERRLVMTWDEVIAHCDTIEELTLDERRDAKDAYRYLEAHFGMSFLPFEHPFSRQISNRAPWTRRWAVEFVGIVERTAHLPNFEGIRKKLKDPDRYNEAHDLVRLANALIASDFDVEFEPPLQESVPDLGVVRGSERFFIELSDLQRSHSVKKAADSGLWFTMTAMPHTFGLIHAGHIYKPLSARHMKEIGQALSASARQAKEENHLCEVIVEGAIEFAFAPEDKRADLEAWAKPRHLDVNCVSGPPIPSDLVSRVKGKIGRKQKQLPADCPNVIVITSWQHFIFPFEANRVISEIEEEIYEHPHVALASLHTHWGDRGDTGTVPVGNHLVNVRPGWINLACTLIFSNRFAEFSFSPDTKERLQQALMNL